MSNDAGPIMATKSGYSAEAPQDRAAFENTRVAILGTRWNGELVTALVAGARRCLSDFGVNEIHVSERRVPGAFELPLAAELLMGSGQADVVIALGAVIRGATPHFDYVCSECARGLREASQRHGIPLGFGVLTVENPAQAAERAGEGRDNKGFEATAAALDMLLFTRDVM